MELSYAQAMEDMHLARLFDGQGQGFYVDIGGNHPVADNVSFKAYLAGWSGLVVEPQAELARRHRAVRPRDAVVSALVGRANGSATFHAVKGMHGLSTMLASGAEALAGGGAAIEASTLPVHTLTDLVLAHAPDAIDWLKIDVEGAEADVIAGNDWTRVRPRVLVVEAMHPIAFTPSHEAFEPMVLAAGYHFAFFDGLNRFYVADEASHLRARFPQAPLDWGSVRHLYDHGRAPEQPDHPDHRLATALDRGRAANDWAELPFVAHDALAEQLLAPCVGLDMDADTASERARIAGLIAGHEPTGGTFADRFAARTIREAVVGMLASDIGRAALGRIAAAYDGGFVDT